MTTLALSSYKPNVDDPRVQQRLQTVLQWCKPMIGQKRAKSISSTTLRMTFGNTSQPFGRWLRSNLLIQVGGYEVGKSSYSYYLNEAGYKKLCTFVGVSPQTSVEIAVELFGSIISGEVAPEYRDSGTRRYHPIQNLRREDRKEAFSGGGWFDYDIDACAATLVYQYAARHFKRTYPGAAFPFPAVERLISKKIETRHLVMILCGISLEKAKELLQSIFFMAPLTPHSRCSIYRLLGEDRISFEKLKQDSFVKALVADLRKMWRYAILADQHERATLLISEGRYAPQSRATSAHRHAIYLRLERTVMDAIHEWFGSEYFPGILMHDGFLSRLDVPTCGLELFVEQATGYQIKLKKERLGKLL
ncbi:hypothetical protein ABIB42_001069 [Massilia sp. UYP32]|uniref:hypothetical protein n=1 Tax=Massilia sp. UYP32 TaxID=1756386 RepID=UPI003D2389E2